MNTFFDKYRDCDEAILGKSHIFWEGHKILRNLTVDLTDTTESSVEISQNFVAYSEYMDFNGKW